MTHAAKLIADSLSPDGARLLTFETTYPRIVHAEVMTHCVFSRNAASSRAIPVEKMLKMVKDNPYIPSKWGKNQRGMSASEFLEGAAAARCESHWLIARDMAIGQAEALLEDDVHKQTVNRLLEPFLWYTAIITATELSNFFHLRDSAQAHPDIQALAHVMKAAVAESEPTQLSYGEWHTPYIQPDEKEGWRAELDEQAYWGRAKLVSAGRSARVSYLTHDGVRDPFKDVELANGLLKNGHMSPFEHVARPMTQQELRQFTVWTCLLANGQLVPLHYQEDSPPEVGEYINGSRIISVRRTAFCAKLNGFVALRQTIPNEHDILG